jgi:hypothetical protein
VASFARRLLDAGARIEARDQHGLTPLHLACFHGHAEVVRVLIDRGADVNALGPDGRSPWHLAQAGHHAEIAALLAARGARTGAAAMPHLAGSYLGQPAPGAVPRIFAPGIVSSEAHETNITFTPDGREICFSRITADESRRELLFLRLEGERWTAPAPAPFLAGGTDFEGAYSPDGRQLFFASDRPLERDGPPKRDTDLWVVERTRSGWSEPRNLGPAVNGPSNEYMPSVDREGNLYFERFGLNVARWRNGRYQAAEPAATTVTNVVSLGHPFIVPDGRHLLFDARLPGSSRSVLFVSYRQENGTWSQASRLFAGNEPREYEGCPTVSPDGKFLFFGRDHDIYWVDAAVIEKLRP